MLAAVGLALAGTLLAFSLFAYGQSRVPADIAGAFVNLEPLVGALAAAVAFHEPFGAVQLAGAAADPRRPRPRLPAPAAARARRGGSAGSAALRTLAGGSARA